MNKKIVLIGGGGHCKSVLDSIFSMNEYSDIAIIDRRENIGKQILGVPIVGSDDDIHNLFDRGYNFGFITLGSIGNPILRIKLFDLIQEIGFEIPNIIDSSAILSKYIKLDKGIFIGKSSVVNAGSRINNCAIINTNSIIEHDCSVGNFVHIAPGVVLGGEVVIGDNSHIGANSTIKQRVEIGCNSIVGIGSTVLKNVDDNSIAYGNPCRFIKNNQ
ncbi:acetyltransferase [Acetoanaerobium noterae]|uniref:acetyltransferase n=1 Tax=Acetoanaerobium noterae TaxID=745369 RepID=UPI003342C515